MSFSITVNYVGLSMLWKGQYIAGCRQMRTGIFILLNEHGFLRIPSSQYWYQLFHMGCILVSDSFPVDCESRFEQTQTTCVMCKC